MAGSSVQNEQVSMFDHVIAMADAGAFEGHWSAQLVYTYYVMRVAVNDKPSHGLRRGYVMENCTSTKRVASACSLSVRGAEKANAWLKSQRMIEKAGREVEIRSYDTESESFRIKVLTELRAVKNRTEGGQ